MKARIEFFISIVILGLAGFGLYTLLESQLLRLQGLGLDEALARLVIDALLFMAIGLALYFWATPIGMRAYPGAFAQPGTKAFLLIYCVMLALSPLLSFGRKSLGLEKSLLAQFFTNPQALTFILFTIYSVWYARRNFARFIPPRQEEK